MAKGNSAVQPETSVALLETLRTRDEPAMWQEFFVTYGQVARRWLRGWGLQPADVEDVWQLVLIDTYRGIRTYQRRPGCRFRSWLKKLCWHAMVRNARRNGKHVSGTGSTSVMMALNEVEDPRAAAPASDGRAGQLPRLMERVRRRVSENEWRAFSMFHFEQRTGAQIAAALSMTVASVHAACSKVRVLMRQTAPELGT